MNSYSIGFNGEELALEYLKNKGYRFLDKNFHSAFGEIDLIVENDKYLIFIEAKTRKNTNFGHPAEAVHIHKQNRLIQTCLFYLSMHHTMKFKRFDVITIITDTGQIDHIENAFWCG